MRRLLPTLRAACLLLAATGVFADAPPPADEPLAALQSAYARAVAPGEQTDRYRELFATILHRVERSYASEVDVSALAAVALRHLETVPAGSGEPDEVFRTAINTALHTLDPHSRYLDARGAGSAGRDTNFGGVGLQVEAGQGVVRVVAPLPGSPAARAGLQAGDFIVRVDDQPLQGLPLAEAIARMRGEPGTPVSITVRRTDQEFTIAITREVIRRQLLRWSMEGDVLVLHLASFMGPASSALDQAIAAATAAGTPRGVVLDLRGNGGGQLREAVRTADAFLREGDIVSLRGRSGHQRTWKADATEVLAGVPMVVLVDRRSASAAELVAVALQDHGRAQVMGQRSFGKGTVQTTFGLGSERNGELKLTTSTYHGPSGRSVQHTGVAPDIELLGGTSAAVQAQPEATPVRIQQARCPAQLKVRDAALSCAVSLLRAGDVAAFLATLPDPAAVPLH